MTESPSLPAVPPLHKKAMLRRSRRGGGRPFTDEERAGSIKQSRLARTAWSTSRTAPATATYANVASPHRCLMSDGARPEPVNDNQFFNVNEPDGDVRTRTASATRSWRAPNGRKAGRWSMTAGRPMATTTTFRSRSHAHVLNFAPSNNVHGFQPTCCACRWSRVKQFTQQDYVCHVAPIRRTPVIGRCCRGEAARHIGCSAEDLHEDLALPALRVRGNQDAERRDSSPAIETKQFSATSREFSGVRLEFCGANQRFWRPGLGIVGMNIHMDIETCLRRRFPPCDRSRPGQATRSDEEGRHHRSMGVENDKPVLIDGPSPRPA